MASLQLLTIIIIIIFLALIFALLHLQIKQYHYLADYMVECNIYLLWMLETTVVSKTNDSYPYTGQDGNKKDVAVKAGLINSQLLLNQWLIMQQQDRNLHQLASNTWHKIH